MRRLIVVLLLIAFGAASGHAAALRFPKTGKHAFLVDLPKGWHTKPDAKGGLLLIPPATSQHAMLYLGIFTDDSLRGAELGAVAMAAAKPSGLERFSTKEPARITDQKGVVHRGTAFIGKVPEKNNMFRRAKIVIIPLTPGVWAQAWVVSQYGASAAEQRALETVLDSLTLVSEQ
jgi:hypothetical protein